MIRSGFKASICGRLAELKPLTFGLGDASGGGVKKAVTPATCSHAPIRQNQSAASAERQTIRSGAGFMRQRVGFRPLSGKDNDGSRFHNSSRDADDKPR